MPTNLDAEIDSWLALGLQRFAEGKCSEAVSLWYRVLDLDPEHRVALERIQWVRGLFHVEIQTDAWGSQSQMVLLEDEAETSVMPEFEVDTSDWTSELGGEDVRPPAARTAQAFPKTAPTDAEGIRTLLSPGGQTRSQMALTAGETSDSAEVDPPQPSSKGMTDIDPVDDVTEQSAFSILLPQISAIGAEFSLTPAPIDLGWTNPWDAATALSEAVDLDGCPVLPTRIDQVLRLHVAAFSPANLFRGAGTSTSFLASSAVVFSPEMANEECSRLMSQAEKRFALGDFSGAEKEIRRLLEIRPNDEEALACMDSIQEMLLKMYESTLGDVRHAPKVLPGGDEMIWMNLHHQAGFLLAQMDGTLTYEDLIAVSGLGRFETFRILSELVRARVIR